MTDRFWRWLHRSYHHLELVVPDSTSQLVCFASVGMFNLLSLFEFMVTLAKYTSTTNMAFTFIFTLHSFSKCDHLRCLVVLEMNLAQL